MKKSQNILEIKNISKIYDHKFQALTDINLEIKSGEIFALLGPNGAGKTTLISAICGLIRISSGEIFVGGFDHQKDYRQARGLIGLVPQEIFLDPFISVQRTLRFARGFFGKPENKDLEEQILKKLSLWDKKDNIIKSLSGGMKRRVLIAKALMNEPKILFLDEPTAGVDVELRKEMWNVVGDLKAEGVTIILTTHYIEEAEMMADRIGIINNGKISLVEEKEKLMLQFGSKKLIILLKEKIKKIPKKISDFNLKIGKNKKSLIYEYDSHKKTGITKLINALKDAKINFTDLRTEQTSLEDIFVKLVHK